MATFSFKQLTLSASRTLSHRGTAAGALSSRQFAARASIPSSSSRFIVQKRAASSQPTAADGAMIPEEVPQIVPTLEEMEKDPQLAGLGYPQFEGVSRQLRNPRAKWDDMQERWVCDNACMYTSSNKYFIFAGRTSVKLYVVSHLRASRSMPLETGRKSRKIY